MSQPELLKRVVATLEELGVEYLVTGSVASSIQGQPRSTHDIDLVVVLSEAQARKLIQAFASPSFYLSEEAVMSAIQKRGTFNLLHLDSGDKVDFWILKDTPFDRSRLARKYEENALGMRLMVSKPEDTILAKLRWAKMAGGSEKQMLDVLGIYEVQGSFLDQGYLEHWAHDLGLTDLLAEVRRRAKPGE